MVRSSCPGAGQPTCSFRSTNRLYVVIVVHQRRQGGLWRHPEFQMETETGERLFREYALNSTSSRLPSGFLGGISGRLHLRVTSMHGWAQLLLPSCWVSAKELVQKTCLAGEISLPRQSLPLISFLPQILPARFLRGWRAKA